MRLRIGRTAAVLIAAVGLVGVGVGVGAAAAPGNATTAGTGSVAASGSGAVSTAGFPSGAGNPGIFTDRCGFSHEVADDPILMPGKTGTADEGTPRDAAPLSASAPAGNRQPVAPTP